MFKKSLLSWLTLLRLGATARGVLPYLLGAVVAWSQGYLINWGVLGLSTAAVLCVMLMIFLVNEYYDYDTDLRNKEFHSLSGGSRVLPLGLVQRPLAIIAAYIFMGIAGGIGLILYFFFKTGPFTIPLGVVAILIGYFYTANPIQFSYRGLGEIAIWFSCGWLSTMTGYYLQTGHFDMVTTLISLPGATSVFLVILMNEIPDIDSDRLANKRNLAVRLGRERTADLYILLLILCFFNIIAIVPFGVPTISALFSIILLPIILSNIMTLKRKGLSSREVQEGISIRTMVFDHLITLIYATSFIIKALNLSSVKGSDLVGFAVIFIIIFSLEGVGIICSRILLQK
jgi:1,4-dihydroxy-2-naphthoate octaprenyltransferase